MRKTIAFFFAFMAVSALSAFAQEDISLVPLQDTVVVTVQDTLTVTVPATPVTVEEPVAPEMEAAPVIVPAPEVEEEIQLYTEAPKEDKQIFNHLAAGIPIDFPFLPDGIGIIEVATTCTPYLQFRLGYSLSLFDVVPGITINEISKLVPQANIPKTIDYNNKKINIGDSKFSLGTNIPGMKLLVDVFPGKRTGFHFTFGAFFNPGYLDNIFVVNADLSTALKDAGFTPGKYNEVYFGLNDDDPKFRISPDQYGNITAAVKGWALRPYVGIGFGRAVRPDKRVCVTFDMGAFFWGSPVLVGYDYSIDPNGTAVGFSPERVSKSQDLQGLATPLEILGKVPAYPVMKLNIFIRII